MYTVTVKFFRKEACKLITELDSVTVGMMAALILVISGMLIAAFAQKAKRFYRDLNYMNMEISRTTGSEREYWKREKKRLWRSLLLFSRR